MTPKSALRNSTAILRQAQNGEKLELPNAPVLAEVRQGDALLFCFRSPTVNKYPFCGRFSAMFPPFLCFLLVILLFKMAPNGSGEMLPSILKWKKAVMWLMEKMHGLGELRSRMSNSAVGCESSANKLTIYIKWGVLKQKHIKQGYVLTGWQKCCGRGSQEPKLVPPLGAVVQYLLIQCTLHNIIIANSENQYMSIQISKLGDGQGWRPTFGFFNSRCHLKLLKDNFQEQVRSWLSYRCKNEHNFI